MEFNEQIYRAPSVPKISRRNISSPVIRGAQSAITPKLKKSTFSFVKPKINPTTLKSETETPISQTLEETNRILVEIQKQLALDFANRIVEKKDALKSSKIRLNKQRAAREEESLESGGKQKEGGFKPFDKVKQKVKSIFDKILDFFTIIATGLIVNNAFNWISKKENQEKVKQFFDFVGKYWKELLALFIGFKITKFILRLKQLSQLFGKGPKGGGPKGGSPLDCAGVMKCFSTSVVPFLAANPRVVNVISESLLKDRRFLTGLATALGIAALPPATAPVRPTPPTTTPANQPTPITSQEPSDWSTGVWATLAAAGLGTLEIIKIIGSLATGGQFDTVRAKGGTIESPTKCTACSLGLSGANTLHASNGMTVPGTGPGTIDSVKAMLAPGEEVIRASAAMMFRPLLKDINNDAGRKWIQFSNAIKNIVKYNETILFALDELTRVLDVFKKQLDDFTNKEKNKKPPKGGGYRVKPQEKEKNTTFVLPTTIVHSDLKRPTRPVTRTTIPITLPTKTSNYKLPPIDGGMATDEPEISAVNMANEYMMLTPGMYGIFV